MISAHLADILSPFAQLSNKHALSSMYKCMEVGPKLIRACSAFGILEASISIGMPERIWIDAIMFQSVIKSLPEKEEVEFELKGGALHWTCGMADGKLALMGAQTLPEIDLSSIESDGGTEIERPWLPTKDFVDALELGGLSCGSAGMASAGVYGIALDNRDDLRIISSDNITVSSCIVGEKVAAFPDMTVLSPDAVAMLLAVIDGNVSKPGNGKEHCAEIFIESTAVYCVNKAFRLFLRPIAALQHDLRALTGNYGAAEVITDLPRDALGSFIKRAAALAESKQRTYITLSAASGALSLSFMEGAAASDEYYLAADLNVPELPSVKLDGARVARALAHVDQLVLDHVDRGVIVLRGKEPPFSYMISARQESKA